MNGAGSNRSLSTHAVRGLLRLLPSKILRKQFGLMQTPKYGHDHPLTGKPGWRFASSGWSFASQPPSLTGDGAIVDDRHSIADSNGRHEGSAAIDRPMLNLGCGSHFHRRWINVDVSAECSDVIQHDITERLPFVDQTFDVVYNSHVLEHLPKEKAQGFLEECFRVLAPGGLIRIVVPDLEQICRQYVDLVARAAAGDGSAAERYDWIVLELLDQMVRQRSGGEMLKYWFQRPMPAADFVLERVGQEAARAIESIRAGDTPPPSQTPPTASELGRFRQSGEVHQWMYDRFSLTRLLLAVGFVQPAIVKAGESAIADFHQFGLDTMPDGSSRKPDSLYMEARRAQS